MKRVCVEPRAGPDRQGTKRGTSLSVVPHPRPRPTGSRAAQVLAPLLLLTAVGSHQLVIVSSPVMW